MVPRELRRHFSSLHYRSYQQYPHFLNPLSFRHCCLHTKLRFFFFKPGIKILVTSVLGSLFLIVVFLSYLESKPLGNLWALPSTESHSPAMFFCLSGYERGISCHHIFPGLVSELVSWPLLLSPPCTTQPVWSFENKDCVTAQVRNLQQLSFSLRIKARVLTMAKADAIFGISPTNTHSLPSATLTSLSSSKMSGAFLPWGPLN